MRTALMALALTACSSGSVVVGEIGGVEFSGQTRAYHGLSHIILIDEADCIELSWVDGRYLDGISPWEGRDFVGLQFTERSGTTPEPGVFGLGNESSIAVWGLNGSTDGFEAHVGREGSVEITDADERGIRGNFEISFTDSGVAGEFDAEWCLNIP